MYVAEPNIAFHWLTKEMMCFNRITGCTDSWYFILCFGSDYNMECCHWHAHLPTEHTLGFSPVCSIPFWTLTLKSTKGVLSRHMETSPIPSSIFHCTYILDQYYLELIQFLCPHVEKYEFLYHRVKNISI